MKKCSHALQVVRNVSRASLPGCLPQGRPWQMPIVLGVLWTMYLGGLSPGEVLAETKSSPWPPRPNIVYIVSDELGYYELSCMGHPHFQTPNIDRLAAEGIRFTQTLAGSSLCAPTRCCLMTGKHSGHTSVRTNGGGTPLRADEPTIASVLKQVGYATGGFGKWGCGGRRPPRTAVGEWVGTETGAGRGITVKMNRKRLGVTQFKQTAVGCHREEGRPRPDVAISQSAGLLRGASAARHDCVASTNFARPNHAQLRKS